MGVEEERLLAALLEETSQRLRGSYAPVPIKEYYTIDEVSRLLEVHVQRSATFTPEEASGTVEVTFTIDASQLSGHGLGGLRARLLAGALVATHEDLSDEGQTVRIPRIGTTATDASDGDHVAQASAKLRIADEVAYEGLTPGQEYVMTCVQSSRNRHFALSSFDMSLRSMPAPRPSPYRASAPRPCGGWCR